MSTRNTTFEKALFLLVRPATLAALAILLINDHLLRTHWPNWWTGKLGDAAWLFFIPFAVAALLALVTPGPDHRRERIVFLSSFLLTGGIFAAVKTIPAAHNLLVHLFAGLFNLPVRLLRDPSDLLALPALALAWGLYRRQSPAWQPGWYARPAASAGGLAALAAGALLTIANMAAPNPGIACLSIEGQELRAASSYQSFASTDGGFTWQATNNWPAECATGSPRALSDWQTLQRSGRSSEILRFRSGEPIERSTDGGQTWQLAYDPPLVTDAGRAYLLKVHTGNPEYVPGPLDGIEDPATGNVVFAMGYEGLLVLTPDDQWHWAEAGENRSTLDFPNLSSFWILLGGETWMALGTALLLFAAVSLRWLRAPARIVILVLAFLAWLGIVWAFPPAVTVGYGTAISALGMLAGAVLIVPLSVEMAVRLWQRKRDRLAPTALVALVGGIAFLLPYLLWMLGILPSYFTAQVAASLLAAAAWVAGWMTLR